MAGGPRKGAATAGVRGVGAVGWESRLDDSLEETITDGPIGRVGLVLASAIVLAFGIAGIQASAEPTGWEQHVLWVPRAIGLGIAIAAMVALLRYRRRHRKAGMADPVASSLAATVLILIVITGSTLVSVLSGGARSTPGTPPEVASNEGGRDRRVADLPGDNFGGRVRANPQERGFRDGPIGPPPPPPEEEPSGPAREITLLQMGMLAISMLVVAIIVGEAIRQWLLKKEEIAEPLRLRVQDPPPPRELEEALLLSVRELEEDLPDAANQITGAYYRLLQVLREAGYSRRPEEAPYEHLHRILSGMGVAPEPMERLTELYVFAEFGRGTVGAEHRKAAAHALEVSLGNLRSRYPELAAAPSGEEAVSA